MRLRELSDIQDPSFHHSNFSYSQLQFDSLSISCSRQASDWRQLLAMSAGSLTFQGIQTAASALRLGRVLSSSLALSAEAASFGMLHRSLRGEVASDHFFENWRRDVLQFGILKSVGQALSTQNIFLRNSAQSFGMFLGSQAASSLDWIPEEHGSFAERMLHGIAFSVALESGGHLGNLLTAGRLHRLQSNLQSRNSLQSALTSPEISASTSLTHLSFSASVEQVSRRPLVLGHRGMRIAAPENTLAAFEKAIEVGANGIEFDVLSSSEGRAVVTHGEIEHFSQGQISGPVHSHSFSELREVDVAAFYEGPGNFGVQKIPLLREVLERFQLQDAQGKSLNIEIKSEGVLGQGVALVPQVVADLRRTGLSQRALVSSFDPLVLLALKEAAPEIRRGLLLESEAAKGFPSASELMSQWVERVNPYSLHPENTLVDFAFMDVAVAQRRKVYVWFSKDSHPAEIRRLCDHGVDALIVDDPAAVQSQLNDLFGNSSPSLTRSVMDEATHESALFIRRQSQFLERLNLAQELKSRVSRVMTARLNRLQSALRSQARGLELAPVERIQIEDLGFVNGETPLADALLRELRQPQLDVQKLESVLRREEIRERVRSEFEKLHLSFKRRTAADHSAEGVANQMWEGAMPTQPLPESKLSTFRLALRLVFEIVRLRLNGYHNSARAGRGMLSALDWRSVESVESLRTVEEAHILAETDSSRPRGLFVLSNHTSFLDFIKFLAEDPLARFGAGDFLFGIPIFRDVLRIAGHFRITRQKGNQNDRSVSERAIAELGQGIDRVFNAGNHVYLFPEGFLSAEGGLGVFKKGASHEAFRRGNYVLLRVVNGFGQIWRNFEFQRDPQAKVSYRLPLRRPIVSGSRLMDPREYESPDRFHEALCRNMIDLYMNTLDQLRDLHRKGDAGAADQIRVLVHSHRDGLRMLREGRVDEAKAWCDMPEFRQKVNYEFLQTFSLWLQLHYPRLLEERV